MTTRDLAKILIPIGIAIVVITIIVVAVYFPPTGVLECTLKSAPGDPQAEYTYTATFKTWKVKQLVTEEKIRSENKELLQEFQKREDEMTKEYGLVDYFQRDFSLEDKVLTSKTTINYEKIDYSKILTNQEKKSKKKNLRIGTLKKTYQNLGANCKYK